MPIVNVERLRGAAEAIYKHMGASEEEAAVVADCLVEAHLTGHDSHGVQSILLYRDQMARGMLEFNLPTTIEVERDLPAMAMLNGNYGAGHYIATRAAEMAIEKARACAVAVVTSHRTAHVGRVGRYTEMVARAGMVGICLVSSAHAHGVAPYGGIDRRLGTAPISMAVPSEDGRVIMLDIATSVRAAGKLLLAQAKGEQIPEGWMIDHEGRPSTDPAAFRSEPRGALLPLGGDVAGYKGFGLGLLVDLISGGLSREGCCNPEPGMIINSFLIIAMDIARFMPLDEYRRRVAQTAAYVKSSRTAPGFDEVLVPGEPEEREKARRLSEGVLIADSTWERIGALAREAGFETGSAY